MNLFTKIEEIPRIGPVCQKRLKRLRIKTVRDLLFHFPYRYDDFSKITPISKIKVGETVCVKGKILTIESKRTWKKRMSLTKAVVQDKTGAIKVVWFNQPYLTTNLKKGDEACLAGRVVLGTDGTTYLTNPTHEKITAKTLTHTGRLVPVYPETAGLSSRWLRYIIKPILAEFQKSKDTLPQNIIKEYNFLPFNKALWQIHFPDSQKLVEKAQERFSFEELFMIQLVVLKERMKIDRQKGIVLSMNVDLVKKFISSLPFKLTDAQRKCTWQILKDTERTRPMNRLLEGDVGSGKTVVAAIAALNTAKAGFQVALMAPTEILSKQHFKEFAKILGDFKLNIGLLTGKTDKFVSKKLKNQEIEISRTKLLQKTKEGEIDILIGTHALIQDQVKFNDLALVILDEQHRFGVEQRAKLIINNDSIPHLLSMTATPIPRTLALTLYGDLDLSLLDEMPKGRKEIITKVVSPSNREKAYQFIREQVKEGKQVFVICPRIEGKTEEEKKELKKVSKTKRGLALLSWSEVKAVKDEYKKLSKKIDILVSTSVVEVGVDIPSATVMMIEGAERFGLAQLHQFRGRVGRSKYQSYCFLFTDSSSRKTHKRLTALTKCHDGFTLSEKDLEIRGPGNIMGTRQWGLPDIAMASLSNVFLIEKTRKTAKKLLEQDPQLKKYPLLKQRLGEFQTKLHLE